MKFCMLTGMAAVLLTLAAPAQTVRPKPTPQQLAWHEQEFYLFLHFGPNTFTGLEWGHGDESAKVFRPSALDTDQWCRIAKQAGAKGLIITAKHHDGFCLWPSEHSRHTVRESDWMHGRGDVLKMLSESCRKHGLLFGVYISPWDRNHPAYGTETYNDVYDATLREIITRYGPVWEMWWDGANGEGPNGKRQEYDFPRFERTVRALSPTTVIFSDIGPDIRWVGNEAGYAGTTNWNTLDTAGFSRGHGAPSTDTLNRGNEHGRHWIPAEVDVSIRPGWFYHAREDSLVKSPQQLFDIYLRSVGRGANLLLNVPPDPRGLINELDSAALMAFRDLRAQLGNNLLKGATFRRYRGDRFSAAPHLGDGNALTYETVQESDLQLQAKLAKPAAINAILLREDLREGQHCRQFTLKLYDAKGNLARTVSGTTIGRKRIISFPETTVASISLTIDAQHGPVRLSEWQAFNISGHTPEIGN